MKKFFRGLKIVLIYLLLFLGMLLFMGSKWYAKNYANTPFSQVLYHIISPIEGTDTGFLNGVLKECFPIPCTILVILIICHILIVKKFKKKISFKISLASLLVSICVFAFGTYSLLSTMKVEEYVEKTTSSNSVGDALYADYYVDPATVKYEFPEKKRNLIYIFMESMEATYESTQTGGLVDVDRIPELTKLQEENDSFNGGDKTSNGYYVPSLSGWTVAGIVGQTCATPINVDWSVKNNITDGDFLSNAVSIGDILKQNGYTQEFMCGSEIAFGGRENYLKQHGDYTIFDYNTTKEKGKIGQDYGVWWGFEDAKLYEFAKGELNDLSQKDEPFNLTLLTADTHFPDGYVCDKCENEFDDQYSNVMRCASKQVNEFVNWCKQQSWYENTTIVIAGDHTTMDTNWFSDKDSSNYDRKAYFTIINAPIEAQNKDPRTAITYDLFPTTLAALNIKFDNDRLGFGTNLYGTKKSILEEMSFEKFNSDVQSSSDYYTNYLFGGRDVNKDLEGTDYATWSTHNESEQSQYVTEEMLPQFIENPAYYVQTPVTPTTPVQDNTQNNVQPTQPEQPIETPDPIPDTPVDPVPDVPVDPVPDTPVDPVPDVPVTPEPTPTE